MAETKSVKSVKSVVNFSSCLSTFVAETQSIKIERLCKTNPISEKPKMNLNYYSTRDYENKSGLLTTAKQTQSNPTCSELVEPISKWHKPCGTSRPQADLTAGTLTQSRQDRP